MNKQQLCAALLAGATIGLTGCGGSGDGSSALSRLIAQRTPADDLKIRPAADCDDWRAFAAESFVEQSISPVYAFAADGDVATPGAAEDVAAGAPEFTETNTQEAGVDEADLLETDSARGLLFAGHRPSASVRIFDAVPAGSTAQVGRIDLAGVDGLYGMYLDTERQRLTTIARSQQGTQIDFFDVSDPGNPVQLNRYRIDGYYLSSRRIDDRLHLIASHYFNGLDGLYGQSAYTDRVNAWFDAQAEGDTERADAIREQLVTLALDAANTAPLSTLVPNRASGLGASAVPLDCAAIYKPDVPTAMATLSITSVNTDGSNASTIASVNNAWEVYASADNLYLAQTSNGWFFAPFQVDQTAVYRFEISEDGPAVPRGSGVVDGWLLNRFSMSEHDGHLRLATSRQDSCQSTNPDTACPAVMTPTNDVTVLRLDDDALTQVGNVTGFGNNERVFSARFIGDVGYVVTFEQIDPLFTFDLSDPTDPTLLGEVEIPGFSSYIYPLSAEHLLTIGRAGGEGGVGTGNAFQLQIFDVSDLTQPARIAAATPTIEPDDWAYSLAEHEPLAFTYAPSTDTTGLLSIPAQIGSPSESRAFSGFMTWRIDTAGLIEEALRIDHKQTGGGDSCPPTADGGEGGCTSFAPVFYNQPLRSAIATGLLQQTVYTLSDAFLVVTDADAGSELARIELE